MRHTPKQRAPYAVWVLVDDGLGWRIVHESQTRESCYKIAMLQLLQTYPVVAIEIRDLNDTAESIYKGEQPS